MGLKVFSEAAESSFCIGSRMMNADISNDKECLKHSRCKPKVFDVKLSCVEEKFKNKNGP